MIHVIKPAASSALCTRQRKLGMLVGQLPRGHSSRCLQQRTVWDPDSLHRAGVAGSTTSQQRKGRTRRIVARSVLIDLSPVIRTDALGRCQCTSDRASWLGPETYTHLCCTRATEGRKCAYIYDVHILGFKRCKTLPISPGVPRRRQFTAL